MSDTPQHPDTNAGEHWTVDGIENAPRGRVARIEREDGQTFTLPLRDLPGGVREGDRLAVQDGPDGVTVRVLRAESDRRRQAAREQMSELEAKGKELQPDANGEITL